MRMVKTEKFEYDPEEWDKVSDDAKDLVNRLLTKPENRLSADEALQHKWLRDHTEHSQDKDFIKNLNIGNMKRFSEAAKLKQVALMGIAVQSELSDIEELKKIF